MKCPLFGMYDHERHGNEVSSAPDCLQEECAWWIKDFQRCCILDATLCLNISNDYLADIHDDKVRGLD